MVVVPAPRGLVVAGGLTPGQTSSNAVTFLDTATGAPRPAGALPSGVHDAAGAVVDGSPVVFGGGDQTVTAAVEGLAPSASGAFVAGRPAALPRPRADLSAVTIGKTTYILGGYDGSHPDPTVLATTDGRAFTAVADLPVPVRYAAVAAVGGMIYVFGGEAGASAPGSARPGAIAVIQRVDPATHKATVVGHLPYPVEGAVAATLDGTVYVAGGEGPSGPPQQPGVGTTQLDGWASAPGPAASGLTPDPGVWAFAPSTGTVTRAGTLQVPVAYAGLAVQGGTAWLVGGEVNGTVVGTVQTFRPNAGFGRVGQPGAGSPYFGDKLLVADRGNNRLLLLDAQMHVLWTYPNAASPPDPLGFYFPDDAFFAKHGSVIVSNQEENETIVQVAYPSGRIVWSFGHPKLPGTDPGYLHEPDDAYLLRNGQITVADAQNCRVLVINPAGTVASQIGTNGACFHNPPASMGSPNGDTPLWDGNLLVSEINGSFVSEYTPAGRLVWSVHLPIAYPSDPQQLGASATVNADRYLIADYAKPGGIIQFNREGQILENYRVASGPGMLDQPSLVEELPNGMYMINDDYNHRMVAIDPADGALVWQYGITGQPGSAPGQLNTPDGFDLLGPGGTTPTHPQTG